MAKTIRTHILRVNGMGAIFSRLFDWKILSGFLLVALARATPAQPVYTTNGSTITLTQFTGSGAFIIPSFVTSIGTGAFSSQGVTSVTIPNSVTNIGNTAFSFCSGLTNVSIGTNVNSIGQETFANCSSLTTVTIPSSVTDLGGSAFAYSGLTSVTIPNTLTNIGPELFLACHGLTNVAIGSGLTSIPIETFFHCTGLINVTIPNNVTNIGYAAFASCTSLTNITLGAGVSSLDSSAFNSCSSLSAINVVTNNPTYSSLGGVLFNPGRTTLIEFPPGGPGSYAVPNSVTSIGASAFSSCLSLTNVTIGTNVTNLQPYAFYNCTGLSSVTIPNSVASIGSNVFAYCSSLTNLTLGAGVSSLDASALNPCPSLSAINVVTSNSTYSSVAGVLFNKGQTTLIEFPQGGPAIYAIPIGVTSVAQYAFANCTKLSRVTVPSSMTSIGLSAFVSSGLTSVTIAAGSIGDFAFEFCTSLTNVTLGNGVSSIGFGSFYQCSGLTSVTIPNSVTTIGDAAFEACTGLTNVTIGYDVTALGLNAFSYCGKLAAAYFMGSAPTAETSVFTGSTNAIAYYLPGTTGWTNWGGNIPVKLWALPHPTILSQGTNFGVRSGGFSFTVSWASNATVVVEACTNLANPSWQPLQTNTLTATATNGYFLFKDSHWTNYTKRFYQLVSP